MRPTPELRASFELMRDAIALSAHCLASDPTQLSSQVCGRLLEETDPAVRRLITHAQLAGRGELTPITASLTRPGGAVR